LSKVSLRSVTKSYGDAVALHPIDLDIAEGEFLTLLGPSGCGKTTTLRIVAGFVAPSAGRVLFANDDVTRLPPQRREIGMVFQDYALFPHMTIRENIGFGLVERRRPAREVRARVDEMLELIRLPEIAERYPAELSGGQQQRVAVARAVAHGPRVLLMDEPLGALDLKLREVMQAEIRQIQQELNITTIYVTHDQTEAMSMSDRIAVMNAGRIEQIGSAIDIYDRPRSRFVADFVGSINLLPATPLSGEPGQPYAMIGSARIRTPDYGTAGSSIWIGIRPEQISLAAPETPVPPGLNMLPGRVMTQSFSGNVVKIQVDVGLETILLVDGHPNAATAMPGDPINLLWDPDRSVVLPA
jgi:ABC-type Fe3+/spermidine/putrescine transport system ATPase subunit